MVTPQMVNIGDYLDGFLPIHGRRALVGRTSLPVGSRSLGGNHILALAHMTDCPTFSLALRRLSRTLSDYQGCVPLLSVFSSLGCVSRAYSRMPTKLVCLKSFRSARCRNTTVLRTFFPAFTAQQRSLNDDSHLGRNSGRQLK